MWEVLTALIPHQCLVGVRLWEAGRHCSKDGGVQSEVPRTTRTGSGVPRSAGRPGLSGFQDLGHPAGVEGEKRGEFWLGPAGRRVLGLFGG